MSKRNRGLGWGWVWGRVVFCVLMMWSGRGVVCGEEAKVIKVGMIGLDTSHSLAFTKELNATRGEAGDTVCRVVVAYPYGSRDIESSTRRIPEYTKQMRELGVEIVDSIDDLLAQVDAVLLETNDGKPHLEQALAVFRAGKPVFIDKPAAAQLVDVIAIYRAAEKYQVPMFSSSSLRYGKAAQAVRGGSLGKVLGASTYSPCSFEPSHADLYWYGIHGCELLYTVMGTGCEQVTRVSTEEAELVVGQWGEGRIGTFRGLRTGKTGYGGTAFGSDGIGQVGPYDGYAPLVREIEQFFITGEAPIAAEETLELYTFMAAADVSKERGGQAVTLAEVRKRAEAEAAARLAELE